MKDGTEEARLYQLEGRPYAVGERLYVLNPSQPEGTVCPVVYVAFDGGSNEVRVSTGDYLPAAQLRRCRRGRKLPIYEEVPRGASA